MSQPSRAKESKRAASGAGESEAQKLTSHLDLNLVEGLAVVHANHAADHLRHDDHVAQVRAHGLRLLPSGRLLLLKRRARRARQRRAAQAQASASRAAASRTALRSFLISVRELRLRPRWKLRVQKSGHRASEPAAQGFTRMHRPQWTPAGGPQSAPGRRAAVRRALRPGPNPKLARHAPPAGARVEQLHQLVRVQVQQLVQVHAAEGELAEAAALLGRLLVRLRTQSISTHHTTTLRLSRRHTPWCLRGTRKRPTSR